MYITVFIIILLVIVVYFIFFRKYGETFGDVLTVKKTPDILDLHKQFDDIIDYNNEPNGRMGYDKCIENCKGYCVEFGLTGDAHCFPVHEPTLKDFNGMIVPNENKLSFPNTE